MKVAVVTNTAPHYRLGLFKLLHERLGAEILLHGSDLSPAELAEFDFPAQRLGVRELRHKIGSGSYRAVVCGLSGRSTLVATYLATRRARLPFVLWASLWAHPRSLLHALSWLLTRQLYRSADAVIAYGPHVSRYVAGYRGTPEGVFEAPQAVDNQFFGQVVPGDRQRQLMRELGLHGERVALFVGRLVPEKGITVLLDAWRQLRQGRDWLLAVAGSGPLAAELASEPQVKAVGQLEPDRLRTLYSLADVLVLPSLKRAKFLEPWGLVVNEAMNQRAAPVVSTAVGAAAGGLVRHEQNGLVVPQGDVSALARALADLISDDAHRRRLGRQAAADVQHYNYESMALGFERAIDYARER